MGYIRGDYRRRSERSKFVTFVMDKGQYEELRTTAQREKVSIAEQIRVYIEWGLEAQEQRQAG